jgi:hypothetical protein
VGCTVVLNCVALKRRSCASHDGRNDRAVRLDGVMMKRSLTMSRMRVVTSESQIPEGWVPMRTFEHPNYDRVKRGVKLGKIEALCLYPEGRMVGHPRRWVRAEEAQKYLVRLKTRSGRRSMQAVNAAVEPNRATAASASEEVVAVRMAAGQQLRELIASIDLLTMAVQDAANSVSKRIAALTESRSEPAFQQSDL